MITFGEFAGTLITDFLQARKIADAYSAALSEEYYVNPVLRGMPVPHYTVDEAEIDVPMKIMGVRRAEITKEDLRNILVKIEQKLPVLLYRNIKNSYYEKQENIVFKKNGTIEAEQVGVAFDFGADKKGKGRNYPFKPGAGIKSLLQSVYSIGLHPDEYLHENLCRRKQYR